MAIQAHLTKDSKGVKLIRKRCGVTCWTTELHIDEAIAFEKRLRKLIRRYHARQQKRSNRP